MKKIFYALPVMIFLAAGCANSQSPASTSQNAPVPSQQSAPSQSQSAVSGSSSFGCDDLITVDQLQNISGITGLKGIENQNQTATSLGCVYSSYNGATANMILNFSVSQELGQEQLQQTYGQDKTAFGGMDISGIGSSAHQGQISREPILYVVSSNGKRFMTFQAQLSQTGNLSDSAKESQILSDIAKIVVNNLDKY